VDIWFGPTAPAGHEANWVQTVPGKGWNILLRLYGPLQPWFDKTCGDKAAGRGLHCVSGNKDDLSGSRYLKPPALPVVVDSLIRLSSRADKPGRWRCKHK
jgi:Protein of unknown function (DUF1214)